MKWSARTLMIRFWLWLGFVSVVVGLVAYVHLYINPFGLGIARSAHFSWERFGQVKEGQSVETVIELLGQPIRDPEQLRLPVAKEGPCYPNPCRAFRFLGKVDSFWPVLGYEEAVVIVDSDGVVVNSLRREE